MKKPGFLAASMAAASATSAITLANSSTQSSNQDDVGVTIQHGGDSDKTAGCCPGKFAPRFDGLRFIETLVTAHR